MSKVITSSNHIEKFSGLLKKEDGGFTTVLNQTIRSIKNLEVLGLYLHLASLPPTWNINAKQLREYFNCGRDKMYQLLNALMELGLLSKEEIRKEGMFAHYCYTLHLKPTLVCNSPLPDLPDAVPPDTVNQDTYKRNNIKNIKSKNNISLVDSSNTTSKKRTLYRDDERFMRFYSAYPKKKQPQAAYKAFCRLNLTEEELDSILKDIATKARFDAQWKNIQYIPHPATYLNTRDFESDITPEAQHPNKKADLDLQSDDWAYGKRREKVINEQEYLPCHPLL